MTNFKFNTANDDTYMVVASSYENAVKIAMYHHRHGSFGRLMTNLRKTSRNGAEMFIMKLILKSVERLTPTCGMKKTRPRGKR